uniref:Uncharacterized protein n=1 Tax=Anguilla anguilla TaxID=7936 RepID=A0A0E9UTR0_ANGAN
MLMDSQSKAVKMRLSC